MHRFFVENSSAEILQLDAEESKHLSKVLRLKSGDQVEITDGKGRLFLAEITDTSSRVVSLKKIKVLADKAEIYGIEIAAAPTKNINRWEVFLEKVGELGIDAIHPILCKNAERKVLKEDRQLRILKSAIKQSQKIQLPTLHPFTSFNTLIKTNFDGEKFIAHCREDVSKSPLSKVHLKGKPALILIGPEGDFTLEEIKSAEALGFVSISLGVSRLRTETAAIMACHTIHLLNE